MKIEELGEHQRALGEIYDEATRELRPIDLRAFVVHEATWLRNTPVDGDQRRTLQLHLKQARDYLDSILALRNQRRTPPTLRIMTIATLTWLLGHTHEVADWIDRLT